MIQPETSRRQQTIGPLQCTVVQSPATDRKIVRTVVLCHGFGAPGDDLVPIADALFQATDAMSGTRFVFPQAPLQLDPTGLIDSRAWWPIDFAELERAIQFGEFRDLRGQEPELLPECRQMIVQLIDQLKKEYDQPISRFVLGGFSQGSMLMTDVTLSIEEMPGGLIVWSGALMNETRWRPLAAQRGKLKVVQSHGRADMILPYAGGEWLRQLFEQSGFDVNFVPFDGDHTISQEGLVAAARLILQVG